MLLVSTENIFIILEVLRDSLEIDPQVEMSNSWECGFESEEWDMTTDVVVIYRKVRVGATK